MEQVKKVVKIDSGPMEISEEVVINDVGERSEKIELSDMDKLPNEIFMKILDYLDERQLVKCRILNPRWNEICCLLLQEKSKTNPNSKLIVHINRIMECETVITESLDEFLDCFAQDENEDRPFPFSRFSIHGLDNMHRRTMAQFVLLFRHIKTLFIEVSNKQSITNAEVFWRLLLKFAPNIEHLGFSGTRWQEVELFDPYFNFKANCVPSQKFNKTQNQEDTFLNKLKVVEIKVENVGYFEEDVILRGIYDLLEETPNVQKLICHQPPVGKRPPPRPSDSGPICGEFHLLRLWQEFNRTHLLKKLELNNSVVNGSKRYSPPAKMMKNLQLEILSGNCAVSPACFKYEKSGINYVHHALKSSQETLSTLFLYYLTVEGMNHCFNEISSLPNLRQLRILTAGETGNILQKFSQICPNITSLTIDRLHEDFSNVAPIIWTQFQGLQTLKLQIDITNKNKDLLALDSAISGYSKESITRIQNRINFNSGISLEEASQNEQQNSSISNLKGLSRLKLEFFMGNTNGQMKEHTTQLRNAVFMKMLPRFIRVYPGLILYSFLAGDQITKFTLINFV